MELINPSLSVLLFNVMDTLNCDRGAHFGTRNHEPATGLLILALGRASLDRCGRFGHRERYSAIWALTIGSANPAASLRGLENAPRRKAKRHFLASLRKSQNPAQEATGSQNPAARPRELQNAPFRKSKRHFLKPLRRGQNPAWEATGSQNPAERP